MAPKKNQQTEKVARATISINQDAMKVARGICESRNMKFSNYVEWLIERTGKDEVITDDAIESIVRTHTPAYEKLACTALKGIDQPVLLSRTVQALVDELVHPMVEEERLDMERGDYDVEVNVIPATANQRYNRIASSRLPSPTDDSRRD